MSPLQPELSPGPGRTMSARRSSAGRLFGHPGAVAGAGILLVLVTAAVFAPLLAPHSPDSVDLTRRFSPPSARHRLGTDELGRDILSRLLFGARLSIGATVAAGVGISLIGLVLGLLAGYVGGLVDTVVSRIVDSLLAFPVFLMALALTALLGPGLPQVTIAVLAVGWAGYARIVRAAVIAERDRPYVEASRAIGASRARILGRHVLLNVGGRATVLTTLDLSGILLTISALSFVGVGAQPPAPEWGGMLFDASRHIGRAWYMMVPPGAAIFLMALGVNLLGDGLRDALDPRRSQG